MYTKHRPRSIIFLRHGEYWWNVLYRHRFNFDHPEVKVALTHIVDQEESHIGLTPAGREQAWRTGEALAREYPNGVDVIMYSPWMRSRETLDLVLDAWDERARSRMKLHTAISYKLVEQDQGHQVQFLAGDDPDSWQFQCERLTKLLHEKHRDPTKFRHKGIRMNGERFDESMLGESAWDVAVRTGRFLQRLFQPHYNDLTVLVVTHLAAKMWLRANLLGLMPEKVIEDMTSGEKPIANCSVSRFDFVKGVRNDDMSKPPLRWEEVYWNKTHYDHAYNET